MAFVVLAKWIAAPGEEEAVAAAIDALIEPSRAEPGNLLYQPHRDPSDPRVFLLYEQRIMAAYQAHGASEHFAQHGHGNAIPRLQARERAFYETWS